MADPAEALHSAYALVLNLSGHDQRILLRAVIAFHYAAFVPQITQRVTKCNVRDRTQAIIEWLKTYDDDRDNMEPHAANYEWVLQQVMRLPPNQQRMVLRKIGDRAWEEYGGKVGEKRACDAFATLMTSLMTMEVEHLANCSGWLCTGVTYDSKRKAKDEVRARLGKGGMR